MQQDNRSAFCKLCGACDGTTCDTLSSEMQLNYELPDVLPQTYDGLRFTADAMDCAMPISMDSHSGCGFNCVYCFTNNLTRAPDRNPAIIQRAIKEGSFYSEWPIKQLEKFLNRELKGSKYAAMYELLDGGQPVQLGALGEPFDTLEEHSGWAKKAIPLFIKYKVAVRISTKGGDLLQRPEYLKLFEDSPDQFWFAFSIISNSDDVIRKVDLKAPVTSSRLKAMKALTSLGCNASLRFRPFIPGISDAYEGEPKAWAVLMERAREAGARAISFEYIFLTQNLTPRQEQLQRIMLRAIGDPDFANKWHAMSNKSETCRRGSRLYKYEMTKNVRDLAHKLGMTFGCSDPHFKEWNDTGCCCGMPEEGDKWFSNWSRRQMTEVVVQARREYERGEIRLFSYEDWKPDWMHMVRFSEMVTGKNWHKHRLYSDVTFGDHTRRRWNDPKHPRGPYVYFGKVLVPVGVDKRTGDLVYRYVPWSPEHSGKDPIISPDGSVVYSD